MSSNSNPIPRSSINVSQHPVVDSQLKSLKLITRRLQSVTRIHEAERLLLQRLFYKNKNQHRGALFWRNISEIRRYSQRVVSLNLLDQLQSLRLIFHGSTATPGSEATAQKASKSARGSWTCFPSTSYLLDLSTKLGVAHKLAERMSEACLRAYISFNRSLQSGAFLSILLTFVAISSRLKMISLELKEICDESASCISGFLAIRGESLPKTPPSGVVREILPNPGFSENVDVNTELTTFDAMISETLEFTETQVRATVILERKNSQETNGRGEVGQPLRTKKKKRKVTRNEIDDIFGS